MNNKLDRRSQRVVAYFCATLFAIFSFFFVSVYQSPLLEAFYDKVATGRLDYNAYVVGFVMSLMLTSLAVWLNHFAKFRNGWAAVAYLPSTLLLAFLTDIDRSMYIGGWSCWGWIVILLVGIAVYILLAVLMRKLYFSSKRKDVSAAMPKFIWHNLVVFVLLFLLAGTLSNGEENLKREALAVSYYNEAEYDEALNVGYKSLDASKELTIIRSFILARTGLVGERLFEYPQLYASDGLLPGKVQTSPLVPDTVFSFIGDKPAENETTADFLSRLAHKDSITPAVRDLYLSSLLLERNLPMFGREVSRLYVDSPADSLPKHFREALALYSTLSPDSVPSLKDKEMFEELDSLRRVELKYNDQLIRNNYVRKEFGRTYWWYFLYGK